MIVPQDIRLIGRPVRSLQTMLRTLSFIYPVLPRLTPDGVFGERTLEAVMLFQREFHPPVNGLVDQGTWDAIAARYAQALLQLSGPATGQGFPSGDFTVSPGGESIHLYLAQSMFRALSRVLMGLEPGLVSGRSDPATASNVRWLQRLDQLPETGILDQQSWNTLSRIYDLFVTLGQP